jgi:hypothetical protein
LMAFSVNRSNMGRGLLHVHPTYQGLEVSARVSGGWREALEQQDFKPKSSLLLPIDLTVLINKKGGLSAPHSLAFQTRSFNHSIRASSPLL